jgi:hypothetical protein
MSGLLIPSVSEFSDLILEALKLADANKIIEIGAEYGGMSALLAEYCRARGGQFTTIDPAPKRALARLDDEFRGLIRKSQDLPKVSRRAVANARPEGRKKPLVSGFESGASSTPGQADLA